MANRADRKLMQQVGGRLREIRMRRGLTQEQVGELAGFTGKYISEIERGLRDLPLSTMRTIVERALGADIEEVFQGVSGGEAQSRRAPEEPPPLPRNIRKLAYEIADLPEESRRKTLRMVRQVLDLVNE